MNLLESVLDEATKEGRVCPQPSNWNKLWVLMGARQGGSPAPLILAAWNFSSDLEKRLRLQEQIRWADANGDLQRVYDFIANLDDGDWYYGG
jgi:hypothetical protein